MNILQHYTTIETIQKIIETRSLHLSDFRFTNDMKELVYGFRSIYPIFQSMVKAEYEDINEELIKLEFENQINILTKCLVTTGSLFLFSLCNVTTLSDIVQNNGILSMWRAYSNDAHGAVIEFKIKENFIEEVIDESAADLILKRNEDVTYGEDQKEFYKKLDKIKPDIYLNKNKDKLIKHFFKNLTDRLLKLPNAGKDNLDQGICLLAASCFFKHEGFKEENEYRVAITKKENLFKENRKFGMVPYIETKIKLEAVSRIIIGPSLYQSNKHIVSVIQNFLGAKLGKHNIIVDVSNIPYRPS